MLGVLTSMPQLQEVTLSLDELNAACLLAGVDELPVVLGVAVAPATAQADRLRERGLIVDGRLHSQLVAWLLALAQPVGEVAVRYLRGGAIHRLTVAWPEDGRGVVLAVRHGGAVTVRGADHGWENTVLTFLGSVPELRFPDVHAPAEEMITALRGYQHQPSMARALRRLGMDADNAARVAGAFSRVTALTEVTGYRRSGAALPGAVGVYDTAWGRIVSTPAVAADGSSWLTLSPGAPHRLVGALAALSPSHCPPGLLPACLGQPNHPR